MSGGRLVAGAPLSVFNRFSAVGSATLIERVAGKWRETAYVRALDWQWGARAGWSIGIAGDRIIVGAPSYDTAAGNSVGGIYAHTIDASTRLDWLQTRLDHLVADGTLTSGATKGMRKQLTRVVKALGAGKGKKARKAINKYIAKAKAAGAAAGQYPDLVEALQEAGRAVLRDLQETS